MLVTVEGRAVLAMEYKSMTGSEGKNLNNRADEVIGAALDLRRAQEHGLLPPGMKRGYVFLMEVTPAVTGPVGVRTRVGDPDPESIERLIWTGWPSCASAFERTDSTT